MNNEKYLELAKKLKALADRGIGGEKENAEEKLQLLMKKYGISIEDIVDSDIEEFYVRYERGYDRLMTQVIVNICGRGQDIFRVSRGGRRICEYCIKCTKAQFLDIKFSYAFYLKELKYEEKVLFKAFIASNNLYATASKDGSDEPYVDNRTDDEKSEDRRAARMAMHIDAKSPNKALN